MPNRVAAEMLEVTPWGALAEALGTRAALAPVAAFLCAGGQRARRRATVRIPAAAAASASGRWSGCRCPAPGEPSALLVVEDATEVLRGQRLEAWAEMARIIAHEIKNPLTPIRLSAEHMREVYAARPVRASTRSSSAARRTSFARSRSCAPIASEFSAYSRIPRLDPQAG